MGDYIALASAPPFVLTRGRLGAQRGGLGQRRLARLLGGQPGRPRAGRRQLGELHAGDLGRGRDPEPLRPDADRPGLRARPGRHAQPERLHGARDRWPVRVGSWQQQVVHGFQRAFVIVPRRDRVARLLLRIETSRSADKPRSCVRPALTPLDVTTPVCFGGGAERVRDVAGEDARIRAPTDIPRMAARRRGRSAGTWC